MTDIHLDKDNAEQIIADLIANLEALHALGIKVDWHQIDITFTDYELMLSVRNRLRDSPLVFWTELRSAHIVGRLSIVPAQERRFPLAKC